MHLEDCLCCGRVYDTEKSKSNHPMIYCSPQCESDRKLEMVTEFNEPVDEEYIF